MNWISVKHRLPDPYQWVLVCNSPKGTDEPRSIDIFRWDGKKWDYIDNCIGTHYSPTFSDIEYYLDPDDITYWMPLPDAPKDEGVANSECVELGHMFTWMPKNCSICMRCGVIKEGMG